MSARDPRFAAALAAAVRGEVKQETPLATMHVNLAETREGVGVE